MLSSNNKLCRKIVIYSEKIVYFPLNNILFLTSTSHIYQSIIRPYFYEISYGDSIAFFTMTY